MELLAFHHWSFGARYTSVACGCSWGCCSPRFFLRSCQCAHNSTRVTVIPRNVCGREERTEYLLRTKRRRQRPGAVKYCAQASGFRQWTNLSNPWDKQLRRLTSLSLAKLVLVSVTGRIVLKSFRICHMALENSITTKNGDNHVASCGLAASLKIFK